MLQVLLGVTDPELNILDTFEDVEYERCTVEVSLMVSGTQTILLKCLVCINLITGLIA